MKSTTISIGILIVILILGVIPVSAAITKHYVTPFTIITNGSAQTVYAQYNTTSSGNAYCVANVGAGSAMFGTSTGFNIYGYTTLIVNSTQVVTASGEADGGKVMYTYTPPTPRSGSYIYGSCQDPAHPGDVNYRHEFYIDTRTWNFQLSSTDESDFTGYPLDGYSPLSVTFSIINASVIVNGTFIFGDGQTRNISGTDANFNHTYNNPGIYTVSMIYFNSSSIGRTVAKNNYILASTPSGVIVNLDVKDAISGALIQDVTVSIRNTTSGVWRNTTAPTGLVYFSTTEPGYLYPLSQNQSITLAANKTGYRDASTTFNIPYDNYRARLFLMPSTLINATGAGTVVANIIRNKDGLTISGISVVMDTGQMGTTNTAGATTLYNVTAGTRYATVTDPDGGYQSTKYAFNLTAGETKLIVIQMVRVGETPVPTYVSPTPTVTGTYDPNDPNSPVYGNKSTTQINMEGGAGVLGMLSQLISLWPLVVIGIFFKFMKSAFG